MVCGLDPRKLILVLVLVAPAIAMLIECLRPSTWDTTVYAPGYSEEKFRTVGLRKPESEVYRVLGKPLKVMAGGTECIDYETIVRGRTPPKKYLFYSDTLVSGSYFVRGFGIGPDERVSVIVEGWYQD